MFYKSRALCIVLALLLSLVDLSFALQLVQLSNQRGILDRAVHKLQAKEDAERKVKEAELERRQEKIMKATRKAMQLANDNNLEDVQQLMNNMQMSHASQTAIKPAKAVETQTKKQDDQQEDEFDGYGSLTEMAHNKEALVQQATQEQQQADEAQHKAEMIKQAKEKMTKALSAKSKPVEKKADTPAPSAAATNATSEQPQDQAKNKIADDQASQSKLSDQQVIEMIDEVSLEQENEKNAPHFEIVNSEPGFIRKFATDKKIISGATGEGEASSDQPTGSSDSGSDEVVAQLIESKNG